jgi:hypothetical protein
LAATQAAWRFWRHDDVTLPKLAQPLLAYVAGAVARQCQRYVLVVHDWSHLNYATHTSKQDRLHHRTQGHIGYDLSMTLAVSDQTGIPLAPVCQELEAADGVHSSRFDTVQPPLSKLDGLASVFAFVQAQAWCHPAVHIIDREADSLAHFRAWQEAGYRFLVRADTDRCVLHEEQECKLSAVVQALANRGAFRYSREVEYHGQPARQAVAQTTVILHREAYQNRVVHGKKVKKRVPGAPLTVRLIVSRVSSPEGQPLAEWLLFSNLPDEVTAEDVALWYYWRWRIESYFKLLKSAGQEVEHWQQDQAQAIAKRLLVAGMACALVWQIARDPSPAGARLRRLLVRLSGRQLAWGVEWTAPALLAGLWVLLAMREALQQYSVADLQRLADLALGDGPAADSG